MRRSTSDEPLKWVRDAAKDPYPFTGFDAGGWEADVWVLNQLYEHPTEPYGVFYGVHPATGPYSTFVGPGGWSSAPEVPWRRVLWADLADRVPPNQREGLRGPGFHWSPGREWSTGIRRPTEGSLDYETLDDLLPVLAGHSADGLTTPCFCWYAPLPMGWPDHDFILTGRLCEVRDLGDNEGVRGSPSNFWPEDRSWFVWTDWDLCATRVSGSGELVDAIIGHPSLETRDYE